MAPPAPAKNGLISASGYGSIGVQVIEVHLGMSIIANETSARRHRTFYPWKVTSSSFTMTVVHRSHDEYRRFNEWMSAYCIRLSEPGSKVGPARVVIPARKFDRVCIPEGTFEFGRNWDDLARTQAVDFIGASEPIQAHNAALGSVSAAYRATYYEQGEKSGDYQSNYAIAEVGGAVLFGANYEDLLYSPKVSVHSNPTKESDFLPGPDGRPTRVPR